LGTVHKYTETSGRQEGYSTVTVGFCAHFVPPWLL